VIDPIETDAPPDPLRGLLLTLCLSNSRGLDRLNAVQASGWRLVAAPELDPDGSVWIELIAPALGVA
jgi:hypothetical protein